MLWHLQQEMLQVKIIIFGMAIFFGTINVFADDNSRFTVLRLMHILHLTQILFTQ